MGEVELSAYQGGVVQIEVDLFIRDDYEFVINLLRLKFMSLALCLALAVIITYHCDHEFHSNKIILREKYSLIVP